ncbi:MAG TPA: SGNH/GDSL hydrolase family protein [Ktedonobacterales bacterium]
MPHVVLLGDSIFDNQAYVQRGEPDVVHQLRQRTPAGWQATLLAVDGSVTADVPRQLARLPQDATHLVLSVGGNDALGQMGTLNETTPSVAHAFARFAVIQDQFETNYQRMLDAVLARGLPLAVCTIYNGAFPDAGYQRVVTLGAAVYDDVILRAAATRGLPALDLRLVCAHPADYANPIEPSATGGARIADSIVALLTTHDFARDGARVYGPPASGV